MEHVCVWPCACISALNKRLSLRSLAYCTHGGEARRCVCVCMPEEKGKQSAVALQWAAVSQACQGARTLASANANSSAWRLIKADRNEGKRKKGEEEACLLRSKALPVLTLSREPSLLLLNCFVKGFLAYVEAL